jgi:6-phosphogluconolactonase
MALFERIDPRFFAGTVADEIVYCLEEALAERGRASIVLCGGSTPGNIYRTLAKPPRSSAIDWNKVDLFFGDERFVSHQDAHSNFRLASETLLTPLRIPSQNIFAIDTSLGSAAAAAVDYQNRLLRYGSGATPLFDLVMLGVGTDGHIASLFPGQSGVLEREALVIACTHPDGGERISVTLPVFENAHRILFVVSGDKKASIMASVIEGQEEPTVIPARFFTKVQSKVTFLLDSGAANKLPLTQAE